MNKKIAFYSPHMTLRGTEVTLYDFAHYNEEILGNTSYVIYNRGHYLNHPTVIQKFQDRFQERLITLNVDNDVDFSWKSNITVPLLDEVLEKNKCDGIFMQKFGHNDRVVSNYCKTFVMCAAPVCDPHGTVYSYVSEWNSKTASSGKYPFVPSIVDLPEVEGDFRDLLGIPKDAIVFGRTGGMDTWNLNWASDVVKSVVNQDNNLYFVFQNTPQFYHHSQIKYIPSTADLNFKVKFINTCDAMLHARVEGESFGVACGEFSIKNKPIITWLGSSDRHHIETLGDNAYYYNNPAELESILKNFKRTDKDWSAYRKFNPQNVMKIFEEVYLNE
jgi:hypothetical protein